MPQEVFGLRPPIQLEAEPNTTQGRFFSALPGSTPKFAYNRGPRRSEFTESMARMIIDVPDPARLRALRAMLPDETRQASAPLLYSGDLTSITRGSGLGLGYFDFLLTSAQITRQEREQLVDTLTDNTVIYYSGESAPMINCAGVFLNTYQDDQHVWFQLLYSDLLRGSALARHDLVVRFRFDSFYFTGYLANLSAGINGGDKNHTTFSFVFRVKEMRLATPILMNPTEGISSFISGVYLDVEDEAEEARHGVQTAPLPRAPRSLPSAAAERAAETDPREAARTDAVPERQAQAQVDQALIDELLQIDVAGEAIPELQRQVLDAVSAPITPGSGDVRQALPASESQRFQDFRTVPTPKAAPTDPLTRTELEIERQLRAAETRGTIIISPVTGVTERASAYTDTIARADALLTDAPAAPSALAGNNRPPETSAGEQSLADVYNPPPTLIAEYRRRLGTAQAAPPPRTRQRTTA